MEFATAQEKIPGLEAALKPVDVTIKTLGLKFINDTEVALNRANEYLHTIDLLKVDIAGFQAQFEVIRGYISHGGGGNIEMLRDRQRELEIELAGALARVKAMEDLQQEAGHYIDAVEKKDKYANELIRLEQSSRNAKYYIDSSPRMLANPSARQRPVEVFLNQVVIQPVGGR